MKIHAAIVFFSLALAGCVTQPKLTGDSRINSLINRPDFQEAKKAAPEWCRAALQAIADAERETDYANQGK